jgi:hypothetical protein
MFVRVQSYNLHGNHTELDDLIKSGMIVRDHAAHIKVGPTGAIPPGLSPDRTKAREGTEGSQMTARTIAPAQHFERFN